MGGMGGGIGLVVLAYLFFAAPITLYKQIPLASNQVAENYLNAADAWRDFTQQNTTAGYPTVLVDWEEVISLHAVLLDQDFRGVTYSDAYAVTQEFTQLHQQTHEHCTYPPPPPPPPPPEPPPPDPDPICWDHEHRWYTRKTLQQVMSDHGFTVKQENWAYEMLQHAGLLLDPAVECQYSSSEKKWVCTG